MKLSLIVISVIVGLFLGTGIALASYHTAPTATPVVVPPVDKAVSIELPADNVIVASEVTVVGHVARKPARAKKWVCGDMYTNAIGGRNRDCEWR